MPWRPARCCWPSACAAGQGRRCGGPAGRPSAGRDPRLRRGSAGAGPGRARRRRDRTRPARGVRGPRPRPGSRASGPRPPEAHPRIPPDSRPVDAGARAGPRRGGGGPRPAADRRARWVRGAPRRSSSTSRPARSSTAPPTSRRCPASTMKLVTAASVLDALGPDSRAAHARAVLDPDAATPAGGARRRGGSQPGAPPRAKVGGAGTSLTPASLPGPGRVDGARARAARDHPGAGRLRRLPVHRSGRAPDLGRLLPGRRASSPRSARWWSTRAGGRPGGASRVADPAGRGRAGVRRAAGGRRGHRPRASPTELAARRTPRRSPQSSSPPVGVLVERMLATSDNDYAESLARLAAAASGGPASFAGVAARARAGARRSWGSTMPATGSPTAPGSPGATGWRPPR